MTAPKARSDSERLQAARAEVPKVEAKIDILMNRRRQILREHDANSLAAINVDREIARLQALKLRLHSQIELLGRAGPVVPSRGNGWTWPSSLEDAQAALADLQPELLRLRAIKPVDRHVGIDDHINFLQQREWRLLRLIDSFAPKVMVAQ